MKVFIAGNAVYRIPKCHLKLHMEFYGTFVKITLSFVTFKLSRIKTNHFNQRVI